MCKGKKSGLRIFFCLGAVLFSLLFLPSRSSAVTLQEERQLGEQVLRQVQRRWQFIQDPVVNNYVNRIGTRILQSLDPQPFEYRFFVLNTPDVNAFAVPGGFVFINSGLILLVENEDELASVICHEIGHVVARHIAKRSEQGQKISLVSLGALLAAILVGGPAAGAITTTTLAASQTAMLKYSREDEEEADYLGLKFMMRAQYDSRCMITMLKKFRRITGPASGDPPAYLLTHPAVEERTAELEIEMARNPQEKVVHNPAGNLHRIQTKLIVEEKDIARSATYFENYLKRQPDDPEAFFGLGLAQKRMGALDRAIENFSKAASLSPEDGEISRELGASYLLKANLPEAQKNLERARSLSPSDATTYFYLGRVYSEQKLADEALQSFIRARELNPHLPELYYHLAMAYGAKGMLGEAYQSFGYYYLTIGDRKTALGHFHKALPYFGENTPERQAIEREIQTLTPPPEKKEFPRPSGRNR
jgi:predicted Zn-dependent protease